MFHHAGDLQSRGEDSIEGHFFSNPRCSESCVWGLPFMTSANISDFSDPPFPLVTYRNQLILFLSSAFWGPPSSPDVIYGSPRSTLVPHLHHASK